MLVVYVRAYIFVHFYTPINVIISIILTIDTIDLIHALQTRDKHRRHENTWRICLPVASITAISISFLASPQLRHHQYQTTPSQTNATAADIKFTRGNFVTITLMGTLIVGRHLQNACTVNSHAGEWLVRGLYSSYSLIRHCEMVTRQPLHCFVSF